MRSISWFWVTIIFLTFLTRHPVNCQVTDIVVLGKVMDGATHKPLPGATIMASNSGKGIIAGGNGEFKYNISKLPIQLIIKHLGYYDDTLTIEKEEDYYNHFNKKNVPIFLDVNPFELETVVVSASGNAISLFGSTSYAIMDYIIKNDQFVGLGYKNNNPIKREIFIGTHSGKILMSFPIKSFQMIYQDCLDELYAVTKNEVFLINVFDDTIGLNHVCDSKFFESRVKPIQTIDNYFFIHVEKSKKGQHHDYIINESKSGKKELLYRVGDTKNEEIVTGLDRQIRGEFLWNIKQGFISSEALRAMHERLALKMNKKNVDFRPVNSEMIQLGDTALLFDFYNNYINCFELNGNLVWRTKIKVDLKKRFTGRVHFDKISGRCFLEFLDIQTSYLIEIDPRTGKELNTIPIQKFKHIDHISVYNSKIFFLHQPDFGEKGKKLFYINL